MIADTVSARPYPSAPGNVFLVGLMGAGKTSVGRLLAKHFNKTFYDCDQEIERRTGVRIPVIFDIEGEDGFRARETAVLQELVALNDIVLATGGGAVLRAENRRALSENGTVVYLRAALDELWRRTRHDHNRPLLRTGDPRARLAELHAERDPLYRDVAAIIVDTGNQSLRSLAHGIERRLQEYFCAASDAGQAHFSGHRPVRAGARGGNTMHTVTVALAERSYPIHIGDRLLGRAELLTQHMPQPRAALVTDTVLAPLYLDTVGNALTAAGIAVTRVVVPAGEEHKDWQTLNAVFDALLASRCERKTTLIALGGGVIGDLTGFAAATYLRGVPFIQMPTTLLAQVDSSVGGKTAINHPRGKNMIGAFYQPQTVIADTATLDTLPARQLAAGLAEVIKYGLIRDRPFFDWLEQNIGALVARNPAALAYAIERSCENKAAVVAADEREESGARALLNLGHTFGHAIEAGLGYGTWLHGEAVAAGAVIAARVSERMGLLSAVDVTRIIALFERAGLPVAAPDLGLERYQRLMEGDKKVEGGRTRFILLRAIGSAFLTADVPHSALAAALAASLGDA